MDAARPASTPDAPAKIRYTFERQAFGLNQPMTLMTPLGSAMKFVDFAYSAASFPRQSPLRLVASSLVVLACVGSPRPRAEESPFTQRDWSTVQLAWRDDPRATSDTPFEAEVPAGRRGTRRSQRRAMSRRRMPLDDLPVDVQSSFPQTPIQQPPMQSVIPRSQASLQGVVIPVETTLASPFAALSSPAPSAVQNVIAHRDQAYAERQTGHQRFDIFLPAECGGGGLPLVVWIHGNTWRDGSKADCPIAWMAEEGYAVASIGYRPSDAAIFPAQLDDCRAAIAGIAGNCEVWGIDPKRIAVVGAAAGGHLASLVGLSTPTARVAAVCAIAAPSHLTTLGPEHDRPSSPASLLIGGPLPEFREAAQRASPLAHVSADDPPFLLVHGNGDQTIPVAQSVRLDAALRAAGVESSLVVLEGIGHKPTLDRSSPAGRALLEFLDNTLGPGVRREEPAREATASPR